MSTESKTKKSLSLIYYTEGDGFEKKNLSISQSINIFTRKNEQKLIGFFFLLFHWKLTSNWNR